MLKRLVVLLLIPTLGCSTTIERIVNKSLEKTVKIGIVLANGRGTGHGSGALIDSHGTVLTAAHVVNHEGTFKIFVKLSNGSYYPGTVVKIDVKKDLALVSFIPPHLYMSFFRFGKPVELGQQVIAFGYPLDMPLAVTVGYVETLVEKSNLYIVHGAAVAPGNSGGPLVDLKGRLVGINIGLVMLNSFVPAASYDVAVDIEEITEFLKDR